MNTQTFKVGLSDEGSPRTTSYITQGLESVVIQTNLKEFKTQSGNLADLLSALKNGSLDAVIVIPNGMDTLSPGQSGNIQVYYDCQFNGKSADINSGDIPSNQCNRPAVGRIYALYSVQQKSVQSHQLRYIDFLLPGVLGMTLMFIGVQGGLPIIQQRQAHIIKRLGSTPCRAQCWYWGTLYSVL